MDDTTSIDADITVFSKALVAAVNLTDQFNWPTNRLSFQSVYENVSVRISAIHEAGEIERVRDCFLLLSRMPIFIRAFIEVSRTRFVMREEIALPRSL